MPFPRKLKILVAPLDWGLGHTTRCIPVIRTLLKYGVEVIIAGDKVQEKVLATEFPGVRFLFLEGYGVAYSSSRKGFLWKMIRQAPHIAAIVKRENSWLKEMIRREKIDGVISDNRLGLSTRSVPCVFITHQLRIQTGLGHWADNIAQLLNYRYVNRFSRVWVPDFEGTQNLAGVLSHPSSMPRSIVSYVGALTRVNNPSFVNQEGGILFIFSGPEPQRSILEQTILAQLKYVQQPVTIIRGKPLQQHLPQIDGVTVYNHLSVTEMEPIMRSAALIVCRSGYSSVMDINELRQRSVLIPTPGQTEQEYLAAYLMKNRFAISADQSNLNLRQLVELATKFCYDGFVKPDETLLTNAVDNFLSDCHLAIKKS